MELKGKYTIGCHLIDSDGEPFDGVYVFGKYGLAYICTSLETELKPNDTIFVIDDLETAQAYIRYISRRYRYEFRTRAKKLGVPVSEFRFYLIKLTDKRFATLNIGLKESRNLKRNTSEKYQFVGNYNKIHLESIELKKDI